MRVIWGLGRRAGAGIPKFLNSKLAEMRIDADGNMVPGAKTVQLEVKE